MLLSDLTHKTCLIGLTYFDTDGRVLKQSQLCGSVVNVDAEMGISIELKTAASAEGTSEQPEKPPVFMLPADLSAWFKAPRGRYSDPESGAHITDPDYLVTWDIHKTRDNAEDGQQQWWQWSPRTVPPQVNG
ncbi:hypothetical protein [Amphritea sp. HPY]|uniref:hypothetical protein n=1 Tax=Amphritea sp. HPY TaxID=3421652 RepID=UPI003D7CA953